MCLQRSFILFNSIPIFNWGTAHMDSSFYRYVLTRVTEHCTFLLRVLQTQIVRSFTAHHFKDDLDISRYFCFFLVFEHYYEFPPKNARSKLFHFLVLSLHQTCGKVPTTWGIWYCFSENIHKKLVWTQTGWIWTKVQQGIVRVS